MVRLFQASEARTRWPRKRIRDRGTRDPSPPGGAAAGYQDPERTLVTTFIHFGLCGFAVPSLRVTPAAPQADEGTVSRDSDSRVLAVGKKPAVGGGGDTVSLATLPWTAAVGTVV